MTETPSGQPPSMSGQMRAVRAEIDRLKQSQPMLQLPPHIPQSSPRVITESMLPPSKRSEANRWTPAAVGVLLASIVPLIQAWHGSNQEDPNLQIKAMQVKIEEQSVEIQQLKENNQKTAEALQAYKLRSEKWGEYIDASLCVLGVRPPYGCPGVELLPRPMRGSKAQQIQPRIEGVVPLGQ